MNHDRLKMAKDRVEMARTTLLLARQYGDRLELADAKLGLNSAMAALRRQLDVTARSAARARRGGLALRSGYAGLSERRLQVPIGRDLEKRGKKGRLEIRSGSGLRPMRSRWSAPRLSTTSRIRCVIL